MALYEVSLLTSWDSVISLNVATRRWSIEDARALDCLRIDPCCVVKCVRADKPEYRRHPN